MKELQKYYVPRDMRAHEHVALCDNTCYAIYLASEADAAFAEKDQHHKQIVEILETRIANMREQSAFIDKQHAEEVERLKAEHELTVKRLQNAARTGMDAAHAISSHNLERARKLHNESKPEAVESERRANEILTEENERLRLQAERYEKLRSLNVRDFQALYMRNIRGEGLFDALVDQLPASGEKP